MSNKTITCPCCGSKIKENASFCSNCGIKITHNENFNKQQSGLFSSNTKADNSICIQCGAKLKENASFCSNCGCKVVAKNGDKFNNSIIDFKSIKKKSKKLTSSKKFIIIGIVIIITIVFGMLYYPKVQQRSETADKIATKLSKKIVHDNVISTEYNYDYYFRDAYNDAYDEASDDDTKIVIAIDNSTGYYIKSATVEITSDEYKEYWSDEIYGRGKINNLSNDETGFVIITFDEEVPYNAEYYDIDVKITNLKFSTIK